MPGSGQWIPKTSLLGLLGRTPLRQFITTCILVLGQKQWTSGRPGALVASTKSSPSDHFSQKRALLHLEPLAGPVQPAPLAAE